MDQAKRVSLCGLERLEIVLMVLVEGWVWGKWLYGTWTTPLVSQSTL